MLVTPIAMFEYGVILNGSQTSRAACSKRLWFEYGVILNGSQAEGNINGVYLEFEYGVISNGAIWGGWVSVPLDVDRFSIHFYGNINLIVPTKNPN